MIADKKSQMSTDIVLFCVFAVFLRFCGISFAEEFTYSSKGKRDPFIPLVGPYAVYQVKGAVDIKSIGDVNLEGIVYDEKGSSSAIINGMILKEGDQAGAAIIDKIEPKKVIILIEEKRYEVLLGGEKKGGE